MTTYSTFVQDEIDQAAEFAKEQFQLGARTADGTTVRDQLAAVWRMTGNKPKELDELIELPEIFTECWHWFLRLNNRRASTGFGVNPIAYSEMLSFFELINYQPQEWELDMIERFDSIAMQEYDKEATKERKKAKSKS